LLVRRAALDQSGGFDEAFFLYSEEVELCWRLRRHGWRVAWLPDAEVIHHESASAGQDSAARQARFDGARVRLSARMFGPVTARFTRAALIAGYVAELMVEGCKWLVGHRRSLRLQRMRMYRGLIASRLQEDSR
jgi:GT2 family glycosyltransferase